AFTRGVLGGWHETRTWCLMGTSAQRFSGPVECNSILVEQARVSTTPPRLKEDQCCTECGNVSRHWCNSYGEKRRRMGLLEEPASLSILAYFYGRSPVPWKTQQSKPK